MKDSLEKTAKSISKKDNFSFTFKEINLDFQEINQNNFSRNNVDIPGPNKLEDCRAISDLAAFYKGFHAPVTHNKFQFQEQKQQKLFNELEKARLVILASNKFAGIKQNLKSFVENNEHNILEVWDIGHLFLKRELRFLENSKTAAFKKEIDELLNLLKKKIDNQEEFSKISANFIENIEEEKEEEITEHKDEQNDASKEPDIQDNLRSLSSESSKDLTQRAEINDSISDMIPQTAETGTAKIEEYKEVSNSAGITAKREAQKSEVQFVEEYKIFTKQYDITKKASDLSNKEELTRLREELDEKIANLERISYKLKGKLKRKLLSKKNIFNQYNKEEGFIDPKKLTRVISNPTKRDNFLIPIENNYDNTVVSFLIDNSGSMRGNPILMSAMACEIICQILEKFSIKTEILGFTTSKWHGGSARKLWHTAGSPRNPGRLSDLCHIIYKNADQSFKQSRLNLALMLKEGILKENIDGEALMFAANRLNNRPEGRKILIVVSDGAPVDDSTNSNNDNKNILIDHLHRTIAILEKKTNIELTAIGIGHDVTNFYQNSITIKNVNDLGNTMISKICELL